LHVAEADWRRDETLSFVGIPKLLFGAAQGEENMLVGREDVLFFVGDSAVAEVNLSVL
jgi:hypothetical protein